MQMDESQIGLTFRPVVSSTSSLFGNEKVLWIVEIGIRALLDIVDNTWLQIDKKSSWDVVLIICLVEENIFSIFTLRRIWLQDTVWSNSMLTA